MLLERLVLYDIKFPRALEHIAANCTGVDEEFVELINSLVARAFDLHAKMTDDAFIKITSRIAGIADSKRVIRDMFLHRAPQEHELKRLRKSYLSDSWKETNKKFDAFVLGLFQSALDGAHPGHEWPECGSIQRRYSAYIFRAPTTLENMAQQAQAAPQTPLQKEVAHLWTATHPQTGHQIGSNDGRNWVDRQTGEPVNG